jgi:hypothetical protein
MADINSIASELDERLSSLFGEDINEKEGFDSAGSSPLTELQVLMLTIDWEISDDALMAFNKEIEGLRQLFIGDPYVPLLLRMLSSLIGYLKNKKSQAHPNTLNVLRSVFATLEKVVEATDLSIQKKKSLVDAEIESFKKLKSEIAGTSASSTPSMLHDQPVKLSTQKSEPGDGEFGAAVKGESTFSPAKTADTNGLALQIKEGHAYIRSELNMLRGEIQGLWRNLHEIQGGLSLTRSVIEGMKGALEQIPALAAMLAEVRSQTAAILKSKTSLTPFAQGPIPPEDFWNDPDTIKGMPIDLGAENQIPVVEEKPEQDNAAASQSESSEGNRIQAERAVPYFFFELGGIKYALDESNVMRSAKISRSTLKKARKKGEITLNDCRAPFSSIKRGLEAPWKKIPAKDLKKQKFTLVEEHQLEGLSSTKGGGILFLAVENNRLALITDYKPQKQLLPEGSVSTFETDNPLFSGSISDTGEEGKARLIVNANSLL